MKEYSVSSNILARLERVLSRVVFGADPSSFSAAFASVALLLEVTAIKLLVSLAN